MNKYMRLFITMLVSSVALSVMATEQSLTRRAVTPNTLDSLNARLAAVSTPADSVSLLYNIFDVLSTNSSKDEAHRQHREDVLRQLFGLSKRIGDVEVSLDVLRNLSSVVGSNNTAQRELITMASEFPPSDEQLETMAFIRMQRNSSGATNMSVRPIEERTENLRDAISEYQRIDNSPANDLYKKIDNLFCLVVYGASMLQSEQLNNYMTQLDSLILLTRSEDAGLANLYYTRSASLYTQLGESEKALTTDRNLLKIIDQLEQRALERGRVFKNYDSYRFIIYRRMLSNYPALSDDEIESLYRLVVRSYDKLKKTGSDAPHQLDAATAQYYMARNNYKGAVDLFQRVLAEYEPYKMQQNMVEAYLKSAEKAGTKDQYIEAQRYYIELLKRQAMQNIDNEYARLAIASNLAAIQLRNKQLEDRNKMLDAESRHRIALENHRWSMVVMSSIGVALVIILLTVLISFRRQKRMARDLKAANERLRSERDVMRRTQSELTYARDRARAADRQKTEFIHSISHEVGEPVKAIIGYTQLIVDSVEGPRREYLNRFIDIIDANAQILQRLVNDVFDAAELENSAANITIKNIKLADTIELVADSFESRLADGVTIEIDPIVIKSDNKADSGTVDTDPQRLEQILGNVVNNAVKFTEKGVIRISPEIDRPANRFTIAVEDCGPGIPEGKEEVVFERFEKLGRYTQGAGLGLHVSRGLARLLGGDIKVDPAYRNGARFVITLPVNPRNANPAWHRKPKIQQP